MSLSSTSVLVARAPTFNNPLLFSRQFTEDEVNDQDPELQCIFKDNTQTDVKCPKVTNALEKCATGGVPFEEMSEDTPLYSDRESCIEMCNMFNSKQITTETLACFKEECTNYEETMEANKKLLDDNLYEIYVPLCEQLGLTSVVSSTASISDTSTKTTASTKNTDTTSTETSEDANTTTDSTESGAAVEEEDDGSGAAGLASGWKGTSLMVAVVFTSLLSGLML